jgi:hypothetical protein
MLIGCRSISDPVGSVDMALESLRQIAGLRDEQVDQATG